MQISQSQLRPKTNLWIQQTESKTSNIAITHKKLDVREHEAIL